jgi:hypothetical protein
VFLLRLKYIHRHPILKKPQSTSFPLYERPSFVHVRNAMPIRILCLLFLMLIRIQREDKDFRPNVNKLLPNLTCSLYIQTGDKAAGAWCWTPTPSSAEVKERVELYLYSSSRHSWPVIGWNLPYTFKHTILSFYCCSQILEISHIITGFINYL